MLKLMFDKKRQRPGLTPGAVYFIFVTGYFS